MTSMLRKNTSRYPLSIVLACSAFFYTSSATAQQGNEVPSLCQTDESNLVSAWMGNTVNTESGIRNKKDGKVVSICTNADKPPYKKVVYRYGLPGKIELDMPASESAPFYMFNRSTGPHMGEDLVFFKNGNYTYYVVIATGQGNGVTLRIYNDKKMIFKRFSGNFDGDDFILGPAEIDLEAKKSSIYKIKKATHDF